MSVKRAFFAAESTTTTGTGDYVLDGALTSPTTYNAIGDDPHISDGDVVELVVRDSSDPTIFEQGQYTWNQGAGPGGEDTLTRTTILSSSNGDAAVNWGAGTKVVLSGPLTISTYMVGSNNLSEITSAATSRTNLGLGSMAVEDAADYLPLAGGTMTGKITLDGAPTSSLHAATKAYVDASLSGNLTLATGDEILWGGASVPSGYVVKTGASYDDRTIKIVTSAGASKSTGGSWGPSVGGTSGAHTLTESEIPSHTHTIDGWNTSGPGAQSFINGVASQTKATHVTQASQSTGGGDSHTHGPGSYAISSSWRPANRTFCVIAKS